MEVVRKVLTPLEIMSADRRYNPETNDFEFSPDGGTTWVSDPASDPRHSDIYRFPPLSGGSAKCDAAARIVHAWQDTLDIFFSSISVGQFATVLMSGVLLFLGPVGALFEAVVIAGNALVAIGSANISAAFTSEVWDGIECIIYCHIGEDGQVSVEQRDAIMADIAAQYPGTVYNTLGWLVFLYGEVLMSNAGVEYDDTGDCDECGCCIQFFDGAGLGGITFGWNNLHTVQLGHYVSVGDYAQGDCIPGTGNYLDMILPSGTYKRIQPFYTGSGAGITIFIQGGATFYTGTPFSGTTITLSSAYTGAALTVRVSQNTCTPPDAKCTKLVICED